MRFNLEGGGPGGGKVGIEGFREFQVDGAAGGKVQLLFVFQGQAALGVEVGLFSSDVKGVKFDAGVGQSGVDASLAHQVDAGKRDRQLVEFGLSTELLGVREGTLDGDRAG